MVLTKKRPHSCSFSCLCGGQFSTCSCLLFPLLGSSEVSNCLLQPSGESTSQCLDQTDQVSVGVIEADRSSRAAGICVT